MTHDEIHAQAARLREFERRACYLIGVNWHCPCGCSLALHMDGEYKPIAWSIENPAEGALDTQQSIERQLVAWETFSPTALCQCGRLYRAYDHPPWIERAAEP
jgi:hypothetical protein